MGSNYKALWTADIHMSNALPHSRPEANGVTDRLADQVRLWESFGWAATQEGAEHLWVCGDIFDHGKLDAVTLAETAAAVNMVPCKKLFLPGNHDANSIQGGRFNLEAFGSLSPNVVYLGGPTRPFQVRPWLTFWPVEFMPVEATLARLEDIRAQIADGIPSARRKRVDVLVMHNSIMGCSHGGWICDSGLDANEVCRGFDHVISGHFHDHQPFGGVGFYLGSPMHHRFDDAGRFDGFWLLEFAPDGTLEKKHCKSKTPRFHELDYESSELVKQLKLCAPGDYVRLKAHATHTEWVELKPKLVALAEKLSKAGLRVSLIHKPAYHHITRIAVKKDGTTVSMRENVESYVDSPTVDTSGLDVARLKRIGAEALSTAIAASKER